MKKVIKNYLFNIGYQLLVLILPLITYPYISRTLLPEGFGIYTYTYSIIQYFVLFAGLGVALYGNRQIAYVRENDKELSKTFWEIITIELVTVSTTYIFFVVFLIIFRQNIEYLLIQSLYIIATFFDISWFFMGLEDFKKIVVRNTLVKILTVLAIFTFVRTENDLSIYILILSLGTLLGNLTFWPYLRDFLVRVPIKKLRPFRHLKAILLLFIPQIAIQIYAQLNKTMLGAMVSEVASGFYNYSDSLIKMSLTLVTAVGTVMLPHIANAYSNKHEEKIISMIEKSFDFVSCIAVAMSFGVAGIALKFAPFFYGYRYAPVGVLMLIEAPIIIPIAWASVIGNQYLVPTNKMKIYTISVCLGAITNVLLNFPLIYGFGLYGAMIATVISECTVTFYQLWKVRKFISLKKIRLNVIKYFISGTIMFIVIFFINIRIKMNMVTLLTEVISGVFIYVLVLLMLKPTIITELRMKM